MAFIKVDVENGPDQYVNVDAIAKIEPYHTGTAWQVGLHYVAPISATYVTGFADQAAAEAYAQNLAEAAGLVTVD